MNFFDNLSRGLDHGGWIVVVVGVAVAVFGRLFWNLVFAGIDYLGAKLERRMDPPIMKERINSGSDKFFEREEKIRSRDSVRQGQLSLGEASYPDIPDELELVRDMWPKPHKPGDLSKRPIKSEEPGKP